jgi:nucleotide-binding universal stress UspA family protein
MTVVVGVDNSAASKAALRLAAQEARWRQAPLIAVTAFEPPLMAPAGGYPAGAKHTEGEQQATAESALRETVSSELGDEAANTQMRVSGGLAGHVIVEAARQTQAELIVIAARPGKTIVPGTVSQYVLLKADCTVAVVPAEGVRAGKIREGPGEARSA